MPAPYPRVVYEKAVIQRVWKGRTFEAIAEGTGLSVNCIRAAVERWERGEPLEPHGRRGCENRSRKLDTSRQSLLLEIVKQDKCATLSEVCERLEEVTQENFGKDTVCRELLKLGYTRKLVAAFCTPQGLLWPVDAGDV